MAEKSEVKAPPRERLFSTKPSAIVVYESVPWTEDVIAGHPETGIRKVTGQRSGEALHVRGEEAHIDGQLAYPLNGGDPLPYGPGKPGCWGRRVHGK